MPHQGTAQKSGENKSKLSGLFKFISRKGKALSISSQDTPTQIPHKEVTKVRERYYAIETQTNEKWVSDPQLTNYNSIDERNKQIITALKGTPESVALRDSMARRVELLRQHKLYNDLYDSLITLQDDYNKLSPNGTRSDQVDFITSILTTLIKPVDINLDFEEQFIDGQIKAEDSYHTLIGACIYIQQQIKNEYKGSWSETFWSNSEKSSGLCNILTKYIENIDMEIQQISIDKLTVHINITEEDNNTKSMIIFPSNKKTGVLKTKDEVIDNLKQLLEQFCSSDYSINNVI